MALHPGLDILQLYAQLHEVSLDPQQCQHQFAQYAPDGSLLPFGVAQAALALRELGWDPKVRSGKFKALMRAALPALAVDTQGNLMLVAKAAAKDGFKKDGVAKDGSRKDGATNHVLVQKAGSAQPHYLTEAEFVACFGGQWIEPGQLQSAQHAPHAASTDPHRRDARPFGIGWFWQSLRKYRSLMGEVLLASLCVQILALLTPLIFQVVIDKVLTHRSLSTLEVMVFALAAVSVFEVVLGAMRHYLLAHTTHRVDVELGAKLFRHVLHLPLAYFESRRSGDTVARVRELDNARNFLTGPALTSGLDLLFAVVYLAVMAYYSVPLTLVVLAALPLLCGASALVTPLLRSKLEDKFAMGADNQAFLVETVASMETIKSQAVEPQWQREWERRLAGFVRASFEGAHLSHTTNQCIGLVSKALSVALLWLGAKLVMDGDLTVGGLIAFNMLSGRVNAPILKLSSLWQELTQMKVSVRRLADILDAPAEPAMSCLRSTLPAPAGRVTFEHVGFSYQPQSPQVLSDLSFDVQPGEIIGLVGVSGAGKTTLTRLLQRLYTPQSGRILLDGMDIQLADPQWLRRQIGVVGQDTVLFNRSVRDNIALGQPQIPLESVMQAARLAGAHDFIMQLPKGYDTLIGERGGKLSGGQRARIAIARALVGQPSLLILDEATAALDYESERLVHDNMAQIAQGRTVFMVAHRLSTLRMADRILVLENGYLVEAGAHAALLANQGRYAGLYSAHRVLEVTAALGAIADAPQPLGAAA